MVPGPVHQRPLRVGLVGAGYVTQFHLQGWAGNEDGEIVAICDPNSENASRRAAEFGIAKVYPDIRDMIETENLDALDIASPREFHAEHVSIAADHGLHALCQKPVTPTLAEAEELHRTIGDRIRFMVHENWRFQPRYRQLGAWMQEGRLGSVSQCLVTVHTSALLPDESGLAPALQRQGFMKAVPRLAVAEVFIHIIDSLRWLLGPLTIEYAWMAAARRELAGETVATIAMRSADGASVLIAGNMTSPGHLPYSMDRIEVIGDRTSAYYDGTTLKLLGEQPETRRFDYLDGVVPSYEGAICHFVTCLLTGAPFETDIRDNLETMRLVEEAYVRAGRA